MCNFKILEENTDELTAVVHGIIMGVPVAFPVPNPDGCVNSGISCPIRDGSSYVYQATLPILKKYPRVRVNTSVPTVYSIDVVTAPSIKKVIDSLKTLTSN